MAYVVMASCRSSLCASVMRHSDYKWNMGSQPDGGSLLVHAPKRQNSFGPRGNSRSVLQSGTKGQSVHRLTCQPAHPIACRSDSQAGGQSGCESVNS